MRVDEPIQVVEDSILVNYFLHIIGTIISSPNIRFEQFTRYDDIFRF